MNGDAPHFLRPPPLPIRSHLPRSLALSAVHPELPRRRGSVGRERFGRQLRDHPPLVLKFGPAVARNLRLARPNLTTGGISMKWSYRSMASACICGAPSIARVRCWIFLFSGDATRPRPSPSSSQVVEAERVTSAGDRDRQAAIIRRCAP